MNRRIIRSSFILISILLFVSTSAQSRPFSEKEKSWIDSLNTIFGRKNPWFDSLMKADGKCMRVQSREHFMNGDTARDILNYYRVLHPEGPRPLDSPAKISFDYYPAEKKIVCDYGPEIYLRNSTAVVMEFSYASWGNAISGVLVRQGTDTLFNSRKQSADTVLSGMADHKNKIILAGMQNPQPVLATIVLDRKINTGKSLSDYQISLAECRLISAEYPTNAITYPVFRQAFVASIPDSVCSKHRPGDTLFVELERRHAVDTVHKTAMTYFRIRREFAFSPEQTERTIIYSGILRPTPITWISAGERRKYNHFVKRNPKKNDPSGIYYDPVFRWLLRQRNKNR